MARETLTGDLVPDWIRTTVQRDMEGDGFQDECTIYDMRTGDDGYGGDTAASPHVVAEDVPCIIKVNGQGASQEVSEGLVEAIPFMLVLPRHIQWDDTDSEGNPYERVINAMRIEVVGVKGYYEVKDTQGAETYDVVQKVFCTKVDGDT